jgi:hypothetical protein
MRSGCPGDFDLVISLFSVFCRHHLRLAAVVACAAHLTACATGPKTEVELRAVSTTDGTCIAEIGSEAVPYETSFERFLELRSQYGAAVIIASGTTEYRCIGGIIFNLQRAQFKKVRFQAEPTA